MYPKLSEQASNFKAFTTSFTSGLILFGFPDHDSSAPFFYFEPWLSISEAWDLLL